MREVNVDAAPERAAQREQFISDVQYYLQLHPRQLPSQYLYDDLGSALFDAICRLPWYRITGAELALLAAVAGEVSAIARRVQRVVELGPGNGEKLATLAERWHAPPGARTPMSGTPFSVHLVDVSPSALALASQTINRRSGIRITTHQASYQSGLREVTEHDAAPGATLVLFLGSNIGNFDPPGRAAFLREIRAALQPGDLFLIGADLVKPRHDLLLAYDDPLGVTAAFNRNLLCRLNRELGGDFDLARFAHRAVWNGAESRIEMHLVSLARQRVTVAAASLTFTLEEGETIWTESSYKFDPGEVVGALKAAGFECARQWVDEEARFALTLARAC